MGVWGLTHRGVCYTQPLRSSPCALNHEFERPRIPTYVYTWLLGNPGAPFEAASLPTQVRSWVSGYTYLCIYLATGDSWSTLWGSLLAHSGVKLGDWVYLPVYIPDYWGNQEHPLRLPPYPLRCEVRGLGIPTCVYTMLLGSPGVWIGDKHSLTCIVFHLYCLTSYKDDLVFLYQNI